MKIAIVSDWFSPRRGGIEQQLLELAERLGSRGHDVDVITSTPGAADGKTYRVRQIATMRIPKLQLAVSPTIFRTLKSELGRGYDVVHAHVSVVSPVGYAGAAAARALALPAVVTFHSVLHAKRYFLAAADALSGLGASPVVWSAVSDLVAAQARSALGDAVVTVLPNGIDREFWEGARAQPTSSRPERVLTIASTMRLHRKKRPLQLLRAYADAATVAGQHSRLLIIGDGPMRQDVERSIRELDLDAGPVRAVLLGWLEREELRAVYRDTDAFVVASTRESFGVAALEARAAGLPVIAMRASGSAEFLEHGTDALLCADDRELSLALARFLSDGALRTRLCAPSQRIGRYSWPAVLAEHEATYARAMRRATAAAVAVAASV